MRATGTSGDSPKNKRPLRHDSPSSSLSQDVICLVFSFLDLFDLVRCFAVCKSWNSTLRDSKLLQARYCKQHQKVSRNSNLSNGSETLSAIHLQEMAMNCHRFSLQQSPVNIFKWKGHSVGVDKCEMKARLILTGGGDKVMRLWSAETYKCLDEYLLPDEAPLVDFDFDESKIVGLIGTRICLWKRHLKKNIFSSREGLFTKALCMRYVDPEAVVGCEDGTARLFDMYSRKFSRIIKMQGGPLTCLALSDDHLIISGSSIGTVTLSDISSDQRVSALRSPHREGIRTLCLNPCSHMVFGGSTAGHVSCWDLRMMRSVWNNRVSTNVIYSMHHLRGDKSTLVVGGIDGVLRILDQDTGEVLSRCVMDERTNAQNPSNDSYRIVSKVKGKRIAEDTRIDLLPRASHPPIKSLAVGMQKVVTMHNDKFIRIWKFNRSCT